MRDHVLLQGIVRVNRPYKDAEGLVKPYGFVLDFIGIFGENLEKALTLVRLYGNIRAAYNTNPYIDIELTAKTKELVRRNVKIGELEMPGTIHELNAQ